MSTDTTRRWRLLGAALTIALVSLGWALALSYAARGGVR